MAPLDEGLLEKGLYKVEVKPEQERPKSPTRTPAWLARITRPSFLSKTCARATKLRRTAYLDGLRGFAALVVYFHHHQLWAHEAQNSEKIFPSGFGYDGQYYLAQLPFIRNFFGGGHYAVCIFFVVSGYVLSCKPLSLIQSGQLDQLGDNLASAMFRRWLRLYIPVMCTTFASVLLWHLFGILPNYHPQHNLSAEIWRWYAEFKNFSFIFRGGGEPWFTYNFHVWSIPYEFRGSIAVYTAMLAFSRCRRNARLWCEIALIYYFLYLADGAHFALFVAGTLLCDLDLLALTNDLPLWFSSLETFKTPIFYALFVVSFYLGGCPSWRNDITILRQSPGWYYLSFFKPQAVFDYKWFYLFWAAVFAVVSIPHMSSLKKFFEGRFCQYLGRISFAFYLVHGKSLSSPQHRTGANNDAGPILWTLGDRMYAATGWVKESHALGLPGWVNRFPIPRLGPYGMELNFLLPQLILLPFTFWISEIVTALVDEPSIKFSQWLYRKTIEPAQKSEINLK